MSELDRPVTIDSVQFSIGGCSGNVHIEISASVNIVGNSSGKNGHITIGQCRFFGAAIDTDPAVSGHRGVAGEASAVHAHASVVTVDKSIVGNTAVGNVNVTAGVDERTVGSTAIEDTHYVVAAGDDLFAGKDGTLFDQRTAGINLYLISGRFRSGGADGQSKDRIGDGKGVLLTAYGNGIAVDGESFTFDGDGLVEVGGVTGKLVSAVCLIVGNGDCVTDTAQVGNVVNYYCIGSCSFIEQEIHCCLIAGTGIQHQHVAAELNGSFKFGIFDFEITGAVDNGIFYHRIG